MSTRLTMRDRVAALFRSRPGEWIDWRDLAQVGGGAAWRTRISECRIDLHMTIENDTTRRAGWTQSRYRYLPPGQASLPLEAA